MFEFVCCWYLYFYFFMDLFCKTFIITINSDYYLLLLNRMAEENLFYFTSESVTEGHPGLKHFYFIHDFLLKINYVT
jgi:hypothetical protein